MLRRRVFITGAFTIVAGILVLLLQVAFTRQNTIVQKERAITLTIPQGDLIAIPPYITSQFILQSLPTTLEGAIHNNADAILISNETFQQAAQDTKIRQTLLDIIYDNKILLIYKPSSGEVASVLGVTVPKVTMDKNGERVISTVAIVRGHPVVGGIVTSKDNPQSDEDIAKAIKVHILSVLDAIRNIPSYP